LEDRNWKIDAVDPETGEIIPLSDRGLSLPGNMSKVGLELPENLSFADWKDIGERLSSVEQSIMWWIGDWWAYGENRKWGKGEDVAEALGINYQTARDAGWVSNKFELSRRRDNLSWSHHREVARLDPDMADTMLADAGEHNWSRNDLRRHVTQAKITAQLLAEEPSGSTCVVADLYRLAARIEAGQQPPFGAIYLDPPWRYGNQATRASTGKHYKGVIDENGKEIQPAAGMTVEEIEALPIKKLMAKDAHIHMWTTNAFQFETPRLFAAWGFEYRSTLVWVKPQMGIGNYWRNSHEYLQTGIRGDAKRFRDRSLKSWVLSNRGKHSAKPGLVRAYIERASAGPYIELFARQDVEGWAVWGNQIERSLFDKSLEESG
jgi:N6-adenosine-specific RNA methylase IME4